MAHLKMKRSSLPAATGQVMLKKQVQNLILRVVDLYTFFGGFVLCQLSQTGIMFPRTPFWGGLALVTGDILSSI